MGLGPLDLRFDIFLPQRLHPSVLARGRDLASNRSSFTARPYPGDAEFSKEHGKARRATAAGNGFRTAYTVPFSAEPFRRPRCEGSRGHLRSQSYSPTPINTSRGRRAYPFSSRRRDIQAPRYSQRLDERASLERHQPEPKELASAGPLRDYSSRSSPGSLPTACRLPQSSQRLLHGKLGPRRWAFHLLTWGK